MNIVKFAEIEIKSNQIKLFLIFSILLVTFFSCQTRLEPEPFTPIVDESIFVPGTITNYNSGQIRSGRLNNNHVVDGFNWTSNSTLTFYEAGQVHNGILRTNHTLSNVIYASNTSLLLYQTGQIKQGNLAISNTISNVVFAGGRNISFYQNGRVKRCRFN